MQMLLSLDKEKTSSSGTIWKKNCFFGDQKGDFTINKAKFSENTLVYCNQGTISTLKVEDYAIYNDYVILSQLILANNCPDLDNYRMKENEVILYVPLYNTENGYFRGVKKWLAYTIIRGDPHETFLSYGYDKERTKVLYSSYKNPLPNIFQGAATKKHPKMLIEDRLAEGFPRYYFSSLPPQTDGNVHLHPIESSYEDFSNYSVKSHTFYPQHLDSRFPEEREATREIVSNYLKHIAEISNSNLRRKANSLMAKGEVKIDPDVDFSCISEIYPQNQTKCKLGY